VNFSNLSPSRRAVLLGASAAVMPVASLPPLAAAPAIPTVEDLMARPGIRDAALSPDGGRVAVLADRRDAQQRMGLVLLFDTVNMAALPKVIPIGDCEVQRVDWANQDRLLVWILLDKDRRGVDTGVAWKGAMLKRYTRRVMAMDRDGGNQVLLFGNEDANLRRNRDLGSVIDYVTDEVDCILMKAWSVKEDRLGLYKVNVRTGAAALLETGGVNTDSWVTQAGAAVLRLDSSGETVSIYARAPGETEWKFFRKFRRDETSKLDGIDFVGSTPDPGLMLVATTIDGDDKQSIRTFDVRTLKVGDHVASRPDRDMSSCLVDRKQRLVATAWWQDKLSYDFKDSELGKHYRGVCTYFRNECNVAIVDISEDHQRFVVRVSGPRHAGSYWFYDRAAAKLQPLGAVYAKLSQMQLAPMEIVNLTARDGLPLTAYLTRPTSGAGKRPLIVMPHGGPELRDTYDYDPMVQTMAAEGWMVLQVNFRGSSGYGRAFTEAGNKRWGDLMQNDIEDALKKVVERGEVDESRLAICGISYGGYAALMGAVKTPDRYRAVVSIAGVSHLPLMLSYERKTHGWDSLTFIYWSKTIGDPSKDRAALLAASPATRADEIKAPVLLMHGELDGIVPAEQSRSMRDALQNARKKVDYVEAPAEGHPFWEYDNNLMMTRRVLDHIRTALA
jgi:dipeptidyl aminopeptidase/acylaminoacyl peptidase